jgi:hypothetical protein
MGFFLTNSEGKIGILPYFIPWQKLICKLVQCPAEVYCICWVGNLSSRYLILHLAHPFAFYPPPPHFANILPVNCIFCFNLSFFLEFSPFFIYLFLHIFPYLFSSQDHAVPMVLNLISKPRYKTVFFHQCLKALQS